MPQGKGYSQSQLDAMAKEKGFPSYAAWKAWNDKYRSKKTGEAPRKKGNFLQRMFDKINPHPIKRSADVIVPVLNEANRPKR